MLILPHLPAPTALHDPSNGHATRVARTAAQRIAAHEPVAAYSNSRLRRDPLRSELGEPADRTTDEPSAHTRSYVDAHELFGRSATSLFFAQFLSQEEFPAERPSTPHETAAAAYPSLAFDDDILLPGEAVPLDWVGSPRLDILV